jgi:hypothetical protein
MANGPLLFHVICADAGDAMRPSVPATLDACSVCSQPVWVRDASRYRWGPLAVLLCMSCALRRAEREGLELGSIAWPE